MSENPKCLFKTPEVDCPSECPQFPQAVGFQEILDGQKLSKSNELRRMDKVNIKPADIKGQLSREDYNAFYGCKPEDCLIYRREVLKIP